MSGAVLRVQDLSVRRGGTPVLEGVSFSLQSRSNTALVGPNGAGKSTLVAAV
ncbi:MAG: ATP-binding cassette domain-containing protein, partial [Synechococcus sp. SB0672_bin_10]|nr:ATP-binding cassette domain-containing protein [Synechococcus sp. SB0672_bin_10]